MITVHICRAGIPPLSRQLSEYTTLRSVLNHAGIDHSGGIPTIDGAYLSRSALDTTFAEYGITDSCWLAWVTKW